jgi:hypothetical protein
MREATSACTPVRATGDAFGGNPVAANRFGAKGGCI